MPISRITNDLCLHTDGRQETSVLLRSVASLRSRTDSEQTYQLTAASLLNAFATGWTATAVLSKLKLQLAREAVLPGRLIYFVWQTRVAWLLHCSGDVEPHKNSWTLVWPHGRPATLVLENLGEAYDLLGSRSIREMCFAAASPAGGHGSAAAKADPRGVCMDACGMCSFSLETWSSSLAKRKLGEASGGAAAESASPWRPVAERLVARDSDLVELQRTGQIGPTLRLRFDKASHVPVPQATSSDRIGATATAEGAAAEFRPKRLELHCAEPSCFPKLLNLGRFLKPRCGEESGRVGVQQADQGQASLYVTAVRSRGAHLVVLDCLLVPASSASRLSEPLPGVTSRPPQCHGDSVAASGAAATQSYRPAAVIAAESMASSRAWPPATPMMFAARSPLSESSGGGRADAPRPALPPGRVWLSELLTTLPAAERPRLELPARGQTADELCKLATEHVPKMPRVSAYACGDGGPEAVAAAAKAALDVASAARVTGHRVAKVNMALKSDTKLRPYQDAAVASVFSAAGAPDASPPVSCAARSGVIVLPCGAGKTLTGIAILARVGRSAVIVCPHKESVAQWREQLLKYTEVHQIRLYQLTSATKDELPAHSVLKNDGAILLTTYSMLAQDKHDRYTDLGQAKAFPFGVLLLDEVHMAPAKSYQNVLQRLKWQCVIGLTATLLREDDGIADLPRLLGPVLHEEHGKDLEAQGHLAAVECCEVGCPMPRSFAVAHASVMAREDAFLAPRSRLHSAQLLGCFNPLKLRGAAALAHYHISQGEQVLVFCDRPAPLKWFATHFPCEWREETPDGMVTRKYAPFIDGSVPLKERKHFYGCFKSGALPILCLTAVGDVAIDLPDARVVLQIGSDYGSRRQEAQRLGRVLRLKPGAAANCALFYSLISRGTREEEDAPKRREYLESQGYKIAKRGLGFGEATAEDQAVGRSASLRLGGVVIPDPLEPLLGSHDGVERLLDVVLNGSRSQDRTPPWTP